MVRKKGLCADSAPAHPQLSDQVIMVRIWGQCSLPRKCPLPGPVRGHLPINTQGHTFVNHPRGEATHTTNNLHKHQCNCTILTEIWKRMRWKATIGDGDFITIWPLNVFKTVFGRDASVFPNFPVHNVYNALLS
jgi:hypothetical protein